jgi:UDP-N-acetylmuramoyl-tripeptide--D-alanyl-D-alanine ligase
VTPQPSSVPTPVTWTLEAAQAEALTGGRWSGPAAVRLCGATVDSRRVAPGNLFVCIPGARVDGHDFAAPAVAAGAALVIAERPLRDLPAGAAVLNVADSALALAAIAGELRRRLPGCVWIGIAGSNGKTTTKELVAAACAARGPVHATRRNLNNHLGVPLTILATPAGVMTAVIELGANHPSELAALCAVARPQVGVVSSFGPEHLEGFGSLAGVVAAECELLAALPPDAGAFVGLGGLAAHARAMGEDPARLLAIVREQGRHLRLRLLGDADLPGNLPCDGETGADGIALRTAGGAVCLPLLGAHNLANACLAWHAAVAAGAAPAAAATALAAARPVAGRLVPRPWGRHLVLDDTYNANPASMLAGIQVLAARPGRRLAVLGAMGELGAGHEAGHRQVGAACAAAGLPLIVVGDAARGMLDGYGPGARFAGDCAAATALVRAEAAGPDPLTVLVKASRSAALERIVDALLAEAPC